MLQMCTAMAPPAEHSEALCSCLQVATSCCRAAYPLLHQPGPLWPRWVPCYCDFALRHLHVAAVHLDLQSSAMLSWALLDTLHPPMHYTIVSGQQLS